MPRKTLSGKQVDQHAWIVDLNHTKREERLAMQVTEKIYTKGPIVLYETFYVDSIADYIELKNNDYEDYRILEIPEQERQGGYTHILVDADLFDIDAYLRFDD